MTVGLGTLITYNPWTVGPATPIEDVAARFQALGIHHVAVVDEERRVLAMLSETDLVRVRQQKCLAATPGNGANGESDSFAESGPYFVRDVMSPEAVTIAHTASFADALQLLVKHRIHALPVVEGGQLVGIITSRDFLRELSYGETPGSREAISTHLRPAVESLEPDVTLDEALLTMHETGTSVLAVAKGGCPLGVVSQRDILRTKYSENELGLGGPVAVMPLVRQSPAIRPGQRLCDAAAAIVELGLPAVTIVNQANRLLGVLSEDDLLRLMYDGAR